MLIIGLALIAAAFVGLCILIDPAEMDRRHAAYLEGYRRGYRRLTFSYVGTYPEAFKCGYLDGEARRQFDNQRG